MRDAVSRARTAKLGLSASRFGGSVRKRDAEVAATLAFAAAAGLAWLDVGRDAAQAAVARALPADSAFRLCVKAATGDDPDALATRARGALDGLERTEAEALVIRAIDLLGSAGEAKWAAMRRLQEAGAFRMLGVSARAADDPCDLARRFRPDLMQLSVSLLDQRLVESGALSEVASLGVEVHLRSIFLDGLLFLPREGLPPALAEAGPRLSRIRRAIAEAGADPLQASLAFALGRPEASAVLVGVSSCAELRAVAAAAGSAPLTLDWRTLALDQPQMLDGDVWSREAVAA